jgi:lipoyl-dependent peroxiredoxin
MRTWSRWAQVLMAARYEGIIHDFVMLPPEWRPPPTPFEVTRTERRQDMSKVRPRRKALYTAEAHVTGGRAQGHGRTSDGALEVELRAPTEMGGEGGGTNPEQLFAIGFAACFESALGVVARRQKLQAGDVEIDSKVMLMATEERAFQLAVEVDVTLPSIERGSRGRVGPRRTSGLPLLHRHPRQHRGEADCQRDADRRRVR